MPFSIKRFTIHRSSSLPTHGGSKKESAKEAKKSDKKPSSRPRGLPTSQSVDTADLRRYNNHQEAAQEERVPPLPPHDRIFGTPELSLFKLVFFLNSDEANKSNTFSHHDYPLPILSMNLIQVSRQV
ncbi:hypothetical protein CDAR_395861 [Caerostris darwini]|uniref:Uncharacterized protein n=1 Tax=Caerostris darwini TaxID=1538125 RepID=A0AAV4QQ70_9ARAC|nr:hypothetical protein CDAR_395861 [Caerostris darwini]